MSYFCIIFVLSSSVDITDLCVMGFDKIIVELHVVFCMIIIEQIVQDSDRGKCS